MAVFDHPSPGLVPRSKGVVFGSCHLENRYDYHDEMGNMVIAVFS